MRNDASAAMLSRRRWLQLGGLGLIELPLSRLLRANAAAKSAPIAKNCVLFLLHGGPSHIDMLDLKPHAPAEVRGEFNPIATNVPGVQIGEHLPRLAAMAHRFTIVRSMTHTMNQHNPATYLVTTGQQPLRDLLAFTPSENDFPHLGAQLALKRPGTANVPVAVSMPDSVTDGPFTTPGQNGGFLGAAYAPFHIDGDPNAAHFAVDGLSVGSELSDQRLRERRSLLRALNAHRDGLAANRKLEQMDSYQQRAFALLNSNATCRAFELSHEPARVRERYGRHKYCQSLLLARRLVEAGVRLVTVYWGGKNNNPLPYWDTHEHNNRRLKEELLPPFDQCFSAFLEDLDQRGLLESTLVVCMGEFGRSPRIGRGGNDTTETGRDHWSRCYSLIVAGGRAGGGRVLGRSDRFAAHPAADPYTPQDLTASILHALGVNPSDEVRDGFGRLVPLSTGRVHTSLFAG